MGKGGCEHIFKGKIGVEPYFVTDCMNFSKLKCRYLEYDKLLEFDSGIIVIALLCSIRQC